MPKRNSKKNSLKKKTPKNEKNTGSPTYLPMKTGSNFRDKIIDIINTKLLSGPLTAQYIKEEFTANINDLVIKEYGITPKLFRKAITGPGHAEAYKECDTALNYERKYSDPTGVTPLLLDKFIGSGASEPSNYTQIIGKPPADVHTNIKEDNVFKKISFKPTHHRVCGECWLSLIHI